MSNFNFITSPEYKELLEQDYKEIKISIENGANKAAIILSGSLIEALLTDYLIDQEIIEFEIVDNQNNVILYKETGNPVQCREQMESNTA